MLDGKWKGSLASITFQCTRTDKRTNKMARKAGFLGKFLNRLIFRKRRKTENDKIVKSFKDIRTNIFIKLLRYKVLTDR